MRKELLHPNLPALHVRTGLVSGSLTVYGSDNCSWTRKQIDYLDHKGIAYQYVNCAEGQCPDFVQAFPTLDLDGKILVGFQQL